MHACQHAPGPRVEPFHALVHLRQKEVVITKILPQPCSVKHENIFLMQMGHQAAQCKTGTIPWRQVFGDEAFVVRKPVFWTDVMAKREARKLDHAKLSADAVAFARQACEAQGKNYDEEVVPVAQASQSIDIAKFLVDLRAEVEVKEKEAKIAADPAANLPPGWNVAYVRCSHFRILITMLLPGKLAISMCASLC